MPAERTPIEKRFSLKAPDQESAPVFDLTVSLDAPRSMRSVTVRVSTQPEPITFDEVGRKARLEGRPITIQLLRIVSVPEPGVAQWRYEFLATQDGGRSDGQA